MSELEHLTGLTGLPLSSNQRRLWFIYKQNKDNPAYNLALTYHMTGEIDFNIFQKSIEILFERHYSMFSVFKEKDSEPYIDIQKEAPKVRIRDIPASQNKREVIYSSISEDIREPFNIEKGPLFRLYILKENEKSSFFHMTVHHLIFDGWSRKILVEELSSIYTSLIEGMGSDLSPVIYQSFDYVVLNEKSGYKEKEYDEFREFWKTNLKNCPLELKFPYDYSRPDYTTGIGNKEPLFISEDITDKLKKLTKDGGSSIFKTMLSVVGLLFYKYSGEDNISIGFPVSDRCAHPSMDEVIGFFINTTVALLNIDGENTFRKHIAYTKEVANNAIKNSRLSFDKIIEEINPERRQNLNPLFQVSLSWWNELTEPLKLNGNVCERVIVQNGVAPFDICFYLWESGNRIEGEIEYSVDLFKQDTIVRLKRGFLQLINSLVENPDVPVKSISLLSDEEKRTIEGFNKTSVAYPKEKSIVQLFEEQVALYPDKTAVCFKENTLTYSQLNSKSNQLARTLLKEGVDCDIPVGILAKKSLSMIIGILGILKAGGCYVPIDPDYPEQRIKYILKDSGCEILLVQNKFIDTDTEKVHKINLDSPDSFVGDKSDLRKNISSSSLAYIMYTSGTTGKPKGSMIINKSVIRLVRNTNYIDLTQEDRILLTGAIVFDASTFEIWGSLLNGATLFIIEKETILDPKALGKELLDNDITILWLTSSLFTHIAEKRTDIFSKLKYLLVGGDVLSASHINKVRNDNPGLKVINGYGPTENTTFSTTYLVEKDFDNNNIPIGKPINNSTAYVFDKEMNYQPIGVVGEIYVGGDGLSKGYLNRDDLNKNSYIEHPFIKGVRLYKTGDYGRWLPDGNLEFNGRIDNQFKIRGFRIELEEIESVISDIEGISETVVKPVSVGNGDYKLVAFLNVTSNFIMTQDDIARAVRVKLPSYMIPSLYKFMDGFPKTINGKTDRHALKIDKIDFIGKKEPQREMNDTESVIHNIWCEALKIDQINITDNFFDIGGTSLMAISVFSKIESIFNIDLGLRSFFDSPRIKDLAETINIVLKHSFVESNISEDKSQKNIEGEI